MKNFKEKKGIIILLIIGVIVASSITVFAYSYFANQVSYTTDKNSNVTNVSEALNDLYSKINTNETKYYVIQNGKLNNKVSNLGTVSEGGYSCSVDYSNNDFIQLNQTGGIGAKAYYPYWNLIINSNNIREYSKAYIDFSYDYTSTYKGIRFFVDLYNNEGLLLSTKQNDICGYEVQDKKFDRKTISVDLNENTANTLDLKLMCYTCDGGTATACIYNLWY